MMQRKYSRETNPEASALVEEHEKLHTEHTEPLTINVRGIALTVLPGVFRPDLSMMGQHLVDEAEIHNGSSVLDLGTGSGFQAILAAKKGARSVVAVDKHFNSVKCAQDNVEANSLRDVIEVRESDLFSGIRPDEKFDVILFNFPFPPFEPKSEWQELNFDPGHVLLRRFLDEAKNFLNPEGRIYMCWSDIGDTNYFNELVKHNGYRIERKLEQHKQNIRAYIFALYI